MKTRNEILTILKEMYAAWPDATENVKGSPLRKGFDDGWSWYIESNQAVLRKDDLSAPSINKASFTHWCANTITAPMPAAMPAPMPAPMPAAPPATAPPAPLSTAKGWLVENIGSWPVEVDIINPQAAPYGWRWSLSTDNGEPEVICAQERVTDSVSRAYITEDEWQEARPMIEPVVGQWYEIDDSVYQVKYAGTELVVVADVDGIDDVISPDGFKGAVPCERPRTQRELILDEFNEWRGLKGARLTCEASNIHAGTLIDFIIDREGE